MNTFRKTLFILLSVVSSTTLTAQSELVVNCYSSATVYNSVSLNNEIVEYALCGPENAFYVVVFDAATCTAWGSNYEGANPDHDFGNYNTSNCHLRVSNYFVFHQNDSNQLVGLNNLLNQIPIGNPIVIYTPISYDYAVVNATCPQLAQTLASKWNPAVIQGNDIMVLFGIEGQPSTFVEDTTIQLDHISFTTTICQDLTVNELPANELTFQYSGNNQFVVDAKLDKIELYSIAGESLSVNQNGTILHVTNNLSSGLYVAIGTVDGKPWMKKVVVY